MTLKKDVEQGEELSSSPRGKRTILTPKQRIQKQNEKEYAEEIKQFLDKQYEPRKI